MVARSSCTGSLRALHPTCAGLAGLHGFTDGTLTGGVSHGDSASSLASAVSFGGETVLPKSLVQGARSTGKLASERGSAVWRMNLTVSGNATVPERLETRTIATARMLRRAEYIFISRPDL